MGAFLIILITILTYVGMGWVLWSVQSDERMIAIGSWFLHRLPQRQTREDTLRAMRHAIERLEADLNTSDAPDIVTFTGWTLADDLRRQRIRREEQEQRNRQIAHSLGMVTAQEAMENLDAVFRDLYK